MSAKAGVIVTDRNVCEKLKYLLRTVMSVKLDSMWEKDRIM